MSLITIIALAFAVPSAMAAAFEIKVSGPTTANYALDTSTPPATDFGGDVMVRLKVSSGQPIADLEVSDTSIKVYAFNKAGFMVTLDGSDYAVTVADLPKSSTTPADPVYAMKTPKEHQLLVTINTGPSGATEDTAIQKVIIEIQGGIMSTDVTLAAADAVSKEDAVRHTIRSGNVLIERTSRRWYLSSGCVPVAKR